MMERDGGFDTCLLPVREIGSFGPIQRADNDFALKNRRRRRNRPGLILGDSEDGKGRTCRQHLTED